MEDNMFLDQKLNVVRPGTKRGIININRFLQRT